jgi:hypothetical protein
LEGRVGIRDAMPEITGSELLCRLSNAFLTRKGSSSRKVTLFGDAKPRCTIYPSNREKCQD